MVTDATGQDASDRMTILHHHHHDSFHGNQKRDRSRLMNYCPHGHDWLGESHCTRQFSNANQSPQGVAIMCTFVGHAGPQFYAHQTACLPNEICVQKNYAPPYGQNLHVAYCVSTDNFVKIAQDHLTHATTPANVQQNVGPVRTVGKTPYSVQAVMTTLDTRAVITVARLEITAQKRAIVHEAPLWVPVEGGKQQCSDCASVEIPTVPAGTQRVDVHVGLRKGTVAGLLYLVSF